MAGEIPLLAVRKSYAIIEKNQGKGDKTMPTDREAVEIKKAMAYDLIDVIESNSEKTGYTPEEIKEIIKAYIAGLAQK